MTSSSRTDAAPRRHRLFAEVVGRYLAALEAGTPLDRHKLLEDHPELADELRAFFEEPRPTTGKESGPEVRSAGGISTGASAAAGTSLAAWADVDPLPPPPATSRPGKPTRRAAPGGGHGPPRAVGEYELLEEIARGGMGVVYRARQRKLDRVVAVKMIRDSMLAGPDDVERFKSEAAAAARLQHPQIVAIHDVGEHEGRPYFSMDYVEGASLAVHVRDHPLSVREAAAVVKTIAEAVQFAHSQGILHRDLKPSNILIDAAGQPRITDFGLAKRLEGGSELTGTGQVLGTPGYMPPEQAAARHQQIGPASDVYALGAILYELLCGRPPYRGETALDTIRQALEHDPVPLRRLNPAVSRDLETICLKCLEKEPSRRYATAGELSDELGRALGGRPIQARPLGLASRGGRWARRNPARALALTLLLALAVGGPAAALYTTGLLRRAQTAESERVSAQVHALRTAAPEAVDPIVNNLRRDWAAVEPLLIALWSEPSLTDRERSRVAVALLPAGAPYRDFVYQRLLAAEAREFDMLRLSLAPHRQVLLEELWKELTTGGLDGAGADSGGRLNAAAALAAYDPDNEQWSRHAGQVADRLVNQNSLTAAAWAAYFAPVRQHIVPRLSAIARRADEGPAARRALAADLLSSFAADDPELLAELLTTADSRQFSVLFPPLAAHTARAGDILARQLDGLLAMKPDGDDDPRDVAAANLAIALFRIGAAEPVWSLLRHSPDPTIRTLLIHRLLPFGADPAALAARLDADEDVSVRRAIILALGEGDPSGLPSGLRDRLMARLEALFRGASDAGLHAAAEWTLRQWGQDDAIRSWRDASLDRNPDSPLGRFVTCEGQVMAVVRGPVEFRSGGVNIRIERSFAFAIKELTREQYLRFERDPQTQAELAAERIARNQPGAHWYNESWAQSFGPDPDCPHLSIPWTVAVRYCRWLSEREGLPEDEQCFMRSDRSDQEVLLPPEYLHRRGYRLPTAAEWEYMCRAGAETERFFGRCVDHLGDYAWYVPNSQQRTWPVGSLKPNDLGVFDIHGNVREWCLNRRGSRPRANAEGIALDHEEVDRRIEPMQSMLTCGGCYNDHARFIRAGSRETGHEAWTGNNLNGLRLVRTLETFD